MADEQLEELCKGVGHYAEKSESVQDASPGLCALLERCCKEIRRSLSRFDSHLLLMATIGSVKSGKSTLTNCLARWALCATRLGPETTRMPMIISASDDGTERTELFSPLSVDALSEQGFFELVIDYRRHVAPPEFHEKVSVERRNLSQTNSDAWAQGHTNAGCAAIFLAEPGACLLNAGIGTIDMPGMDGLTSNWHDEALHGRMNENAEYFLPVQSSFAALTPDTRDYLRAAMERSQRLDARQKKVGEAMDMFVSRRISALENCLLAELSAWELSGLTGTSVEAAQHDIELVHALRKSLSPSLLNARQLKALQYL